ncbi:MAG: hypothetical protein F9K16_13205 [Thermoanaerobaculia bacterium]|nr:MAG: hypothetical protein F9K16_13205 [Thermoanaerobaculia bacterium]
MVSLLLSAAMLVTTLTPVVTVPSRPIVTVIDLAKAPLYREKERWLGKRLSEVLPGSSVSRLLLLTAVTSATADLDAFNITRLLSQDVAFEHAPRDWDSAVVIWEAVIETADGHTFRIRATNTWAQLISPEAHGFFQFQLVHRPAV